MRNNQQGFSLPEMMMVIAVIAIAASIAVPDYLAQLPDKRLKSAARDLYSSMQRARLGAVRDNTTWAVVRDGTNNRYLVCSSPGADSTWSTTADNTVVTTVSLNSYQSGITFGSGNATQNWNGNNCTQATTITFTANGTASSGSIYLENRNQDICYAVTALSTGAVKLRKYNGNLPFNVNNWN